MTKTEGNARKNEKKTHTKILFRDRNRLAVELAGQHFSTGAGGSRGAERARRRLQIKRFGARPAVIRVSIFFWAIFHVITHHFTAIKIWKFRLAAVYRGGSTPSIFLGSPYPPMRTRLINLSVGKNRLSFTRNKIGVYYIFRWYLIRTTGLDRLLNNY